MSNWCKGFCRSCGTGCGQYCDEIAALKTSLLDAELRGYERAINLLKGQLVDEYENGFDVSELQSTIEFLEDPAILTQPPKAES